MSKISISKSDGWFVITDEETGVTTQGKTKIEALLMLADALALEQDEDVDLMAIAHTVFQLSEQDRAILRELANRDSDEGEPDRYCPDCGWSVRIPRQERDGDA